MSASAPLYRVLCRHTISQLQYGGGYALKAGVVVSLATALLEFQSPSQREQLQRWVRKCKGCQELNGHRQRRRQNSSTCQVTAVNSGAGCMLHSMLAHST